ncbi:YeeE/YedE family protein [Acinetobacter portensis]|uniref:YeeE/YedE family protein n=2 Tax=Acinetobacter TaxID=469 RepID=A0AB35UYU7_9GAMM|nr:MULTISPECIES: YeeE/YedE family protein [Acinetobacter]MCK7610318.1 YeeE/YedE family protein [Acinetobacter portensis]MCK7641102.1 YeeE/YedE family protein [Acinetobacter portensis]MDY6449619.1 YeeE/YedE family protein [Acinetobacter faecalis]MDY6460399.1 YeeE/YedE family protein [Acinetobacter faecalis]MDY6485481.1 YeeE/YedE family protein [Acinetobacter faecalis]
MSIIAAPANRSNVSVWVAFILLILGTLGTYQVVSTNQALLFLIGGALGMTLYHASFGFTSSWRVFIKERRGRGLRAQMIMLSLAVLLFFPALGAGELFGNPVKGNVSPVSMSVMIGAFIFGIGMQLGGGCASGTLYTVGGGSARMIVTLVFFCLGSLIATSHIDWWFNLPHLAPISLVSSLGVAPALFINFVLFALIAAITVFAEKKRHGSLEIEPRSEYQGWKRFIRGPWPLIWGGIILTLLNFATLALAGRPWGVTSALAVWAAKSASFVGVDVASWAYWQQPGNAKALAESLWFDITSMMNFGIMIGALFAASLAGKFAPNFNIPKRSLVAAIVGGLLLGYGARLAYGCNIGAYFSGIASGSLHGWLWLVFAFIGNSVGVKLRPIFFPNEKPKHEQLTGC